MRIQIIQAPHKWVLPKQEIYIIESPQTLETQGQKPSMQSSKYAVHTEQKKVYEERPLNDEIDTRPSWKLTTQDGAKLAGAED